MTQTVDKKQQKQEEEDAKCKKMHFRLSSGSFLFSPATSCVRVALILEKLLLRNKNVSGLCCCVCVCVCVCAAAAVRVGQEGKV